MLWAQFHGTIENTVIDQGWATRDEVDAIYMELQEWAGQLNTFAVFVLCSGIGWVPVCEL
jgi:hypothetical protein